MGERKKVNEQHPDYAKYYAECMELQKRMELASKDIKYTGGLDGGWADISSKFNDEFKEIKKRYSYLFTEEWHD